MRLNVHELGDPAGRPLVCLHGVTGHGLRFRALAERLPGWRVLGVDYRGHGASGREPPWGVEAHVADLCETADALGLERPAWLGHSFGAKLICELAARRPERVSRAVLLDPALHVDPSVAAERAELLRADTSFATVDEAIEMRLADATLHTTPRSTIETEAADHLEQGADGRWRWRYSPPAVIVAWSEMTMPPPPYPPGETLLVLGARSWIPPVEPVPPNVRVVTVPGGHSVLWDDLDATADAIGAFLA